ncbi:MAG: dienelactone hydrolase family protein [Pseudomonadota bacterium]|nr:dienelactone hydrolase family protein [Pseudomonadota bacterium]
MSTPEFLVTGSPHAAWTLVLAPGAGQDMRSTFMTAFAVGLTARGSVLGGLRVVRFDFPYMIRARESGKKTPPDREPVLLDTWRAAIAALEAAGRPRARMIIGGKSLGGRMASLIADQQGVAGLVCLGYPFHPPGQAEQLRTAHLQALHTPALILQGSRDPLGSREEVAEYALAPGIRLHWLEDGDHSFKPRKDSGVTEVENWKSAMDAIIGFIGGLGR